jgi:alpha-galactosidase
LKKLFFSLILFLPSIIFPQKFEGLAPTPPMGWNSWNSFQTNVDEQLIKETADALIKSGMCDAGRCAREFIQNRSESKIIL